MRKSVVYTWIALAVVLAQAVAAQQGGIRGTVMDLDFEVPLPGVTVRISETEQEAVSGDAGSFYLEKLEPGAYTVLFSKAGYTRVTESGVVVTPGQLSEIEVEMAGEYEEMDELVVRDIQLGGSSEIGLLNLRMESASMMDAVGADLMSRAGASDAAQALALVPGTTVQDGKYAVVRGLPDRYVSSQMNGVRLPTADVDKRAVQLDQFPAAMIESMQVAKTFTPDQQGDASGGAVNVVLKGIPDKRILKLSAGSEFNTQVLEASDQFLTYQGGGVSTWGRAERNPQPSGTAWSGAVGVSRGDAPESYSLGVTAGDKWVFESGIKVGALGSFFYKRDASYYENGRDDSYWQLNEGGPLTPFTDGDDPNFTKLYDVTKSSEEVQWGGLGVVGVESDHHALSLLYSFTQSTEDEAVLQEDTRGKHYFFPGHDRFDPSSPGFGDDGDQTRVNPYRRNETLEYTERRAETLQLHGEHTVALPEWGLGSFIAFLDPEIDWTVAGSSSNLKTPDKREFSTFWVPGYTIAGLFDVPAEHVEKAGSISLGGLQRIWKEVNEESDQYFVNGKLPFEQWSGDDGFIKFGVFEDRVRRDYTQETFSNTDPFSTASSSGYDWLEPWSERFPDEGYAINAAEIDVNYRGEQDVSAWYYMADIPLWNALSFVGGTRFEQTDLATRVDPDDEVRLYLKANNYQPLPFPSNKELAYVDYHQNDVLPSLGFEFSPSDNVVIRGTYSETVARQTFKELTPIQQQESAVDDVFIGNPNLKMSALENYDLRVDYNPYPGGLFSFSWFRKDINNPIEYKSLLIEGDIGITAVNYAAGRMSGYEAEVRQSLGHFWDALDGLNVGGNMTLINSDVSIPQDEQDLLAAVGAPRSSRDMLNTPEFLYNLNATCTLKRFGTEFGLFYTVKGDTLLTGAATQSSNLIPDVYAKERATLNFTLSQKIGERLKLSFKAKNLTDSAVQEVYRSDYVSGGDVVKKSYKKGIDYSIGISGTW